MMRKLMIAALVLLPLGAQAQQAWGNEGGCNRVAGRDEGTDMVTILWPDRIEHLESGCRFIMINGDINVRATIETECDGEGETWTQTYGMTPIGADTIAIWPADAPDYVQNLRLCE
tara:strand:+ start:643 stop:990 length:348 start_codon:yes stop_codon:yes gene_type:complete